jgi:hypothetical protein
LFNDSVSLGILQLHDQLMGTVNNHGTIKGVLQLFQLRPFCVIALMEASIHLYDAIVTKPKSVLSRDATGGIVKSQQSPSKQILYYELTLAHSCIVAEDSLIL